MLHKKCKGSKDREKKIPIGPTSLSLRQESRAVTEALFIPMGMIKKSTITKSRLLDYKHEKELGFSFK